MSDQLPPIIPEAVLSPGGNPTELAPQDAFPEELLGLPLLELQVLHSMVSRRLDQEYQSVEGPHPITLERLQCLTVELDSRALAPTPAGVLHGTLD